MFYMGFFLGVDAKGEGYEQTYDIMGRHANSQLVKKAGENKHHSASGFGTPASAHQRGINVPSHEIIDRFIPRPPVSPDAGAVPPVRIELPVAESHHLCKSIEGRLKNSEEAGEPDDERYR